MLAPILLMGCDRASQYDRAYDAAWEGEGTPSSFWSSQEERDGYEQGLDDADMYDEGYEDGKNKRKPKYKDDVDYMDGYKDGTKDCY